MKCAIEWQPEDKVYAASAFAVYKMDPSQLAGCPHTSYSLRCMAVMMEMLHQRSHISVGRSGPQKTDLMLHVRCSNNTGEEEGSLFHGVK